MKKTILFFLLITEFACSQNPKSIQISKTDLEWKQTLTPEQYRVTRQMETERPFKGAFWNSQEVGKYNCGCCGTLLFSSTEKFDSGCGLPSFSNFSKKENILETKDSSLGMEQIEISCKKCGAHLGHFFDDGSPPSHLRYCINSAFLKFTKE